MKEGKKMETEEEYRERIRTETPEEHKKRIAIMNVKSVDLTTVFYVEGSSPANL